MKRIINGQVYDTATSEFLYDLPTKGYGWNDFQYHETALYRTKGGAFFLAGRGGPLTMWRKPTGNGWTEGEGIKPLTPAEALAQMEKDGETSVIEETYGDVFPEAGSDEVSAVAIPRDLRAPLAAAAAAEGVDAAAYVAAHLRAALLAEAGAA